MQPKGFCSCLSGISDRAGTWLGAQGAPTLLWDKQAKKHHPAPGCSPEINGGSYLWRHVCNGPMNFMEMRCCGGVWYWVLLRLLKLMPLKSQPSAASLLQRWDKGSNEDRDARAQLAQRLGRGHRRVPGSCHTAAAWHREQLRHEERWPSAQPPGLSTVMFYSPHTPLPKCKKKGGEGGETSTGCCSL